MRRRRVEGGGLKGRRRIGGVVEVGYRRDVRGVDVGRGCAEGLFLFLHAARSGEVDAGADSREADAQRTTQQLFFCLTLDFPRFCLLARSHALFPLPK